MSDIISTIELQKGSAENSVESSVVATELLPSTNPDLGQVAPKPEITKEEEVVDEKKESDNEIAMTDDKPSTGFDYPNNAEEIPSANGSKTIWAEIVRRKGRGERIPENQS